MEASSKFVEALAQLTGALAWPAVIVFLVYKFGLTLREFINNIGEGSIKGFGVEATAKRKAEAVAAISVAQAESKQKIRQADGQASDTEKELIGDHPVDPIKFIDNSSFKISSNKTILWVDDQPENNSYEQKAFKSLGFRIFNAKNTTDAIKFIKDNDPFDVIISDMTRPEGKQAGYDLLAQVKNMGISTPFIIYSGYSGSAQKVKAQSMGAFGHTSDPGRLAELVLNAVKYANSFG